MVTQIIWYDISLDYFSYLKRLSIMLHLCAIGLYIKKEIMYTDDIMVTRLVKHWINEAITVSACAYQKYL